MDKAFTPSPPSPLQESRTITTMAQIHANPSQRRRTITMPCPLSPTRETRTKDADLVQVEEIDITDEIAHLVEIDLASIELSPTGLSNPYEEVDDHIITTQPPTNHENQNLPRQEIEAEIAIDNITHLPLNTENQNIPQQELDTEITIVNGNATVLYPIPECLVCPFGSCNTIFKGLAWTATKQSVIRHIRQIHNTAIDQTNYKCRKCLQDIGIRPSKHNCENAIVQRSRASDFFWKCDYCPESFPSTKALKNHTTAHVRREIRGQRNDTIPTPRTRKHRRARRGSSSSHDEDLTSTQSSEPIEVVQETEATQSRHQICTLQTAHNPSYLTTTMEANLDEIAIIRSASPLSPPPNRHNPDNDYTQRAHHNQLDPLQTPTQIEAIRPLTVETESSIELSVEEVWSENGAVLPSQSTQGDPDPEPSQNDSTTSDVTTLEEFNMALQAILDQPPAESRWNEFLNILDRVLQKIQRKYNIKKPANSYKTHNNEELARAKKIQKIYKNNRRRAIRIIRNEPTRYCQIPAETIENHFSKTWQWKEVNIDTEDPPSDHPDIDTTPFSEEDVRRRLRKFENSSPGEDGISYNHWKSSDPDCITITKILNTCLKYERTPNEWKRSRTILIHKSGNPDQITNWRPIALCPTIYKLYAGCLQSRLSTWLSTNNILNPNQKGFTAHDGIIEHNFILQKLINSAKHEKQALAIAWIDISNAFGSVPHSALEKALNRYGVGKKFINITMEILENNSTQIHSAEAITDEIPVRCGIKQGCPLSGPLFNIAINPILDRIQTNENTPSILAYADDLVLIGKSPSDLQEKIDTANELLQNITLKLNCNKCKSLTIEHNKISNKKYKIDQQQIQALDTYDEEKFLGQPIAFTRIKSSEGMGELIKLGLDILKSELAPWQRLDALKTFVFPAFHFYMRSDRFELTEWKKLDNIFRAEIKKTLNLPDEATNEYIYGPQSQNLIGIPVSAELANTARIDTAFKLLTSRDGAVREMAREDLTRTVSKRTRILEPNSETIEEFLNGAMDKAHFKNTRNEASNIWTATRKASVNLGVEWTIQWPRVQIEVANTTIESEKRRIVMYTIRKMNDIKRAEKLSTLKNQGKTLPCLAADPASGHFLKDGKYTRFADWRFIHKARLNLVQLKANQRWKEGNRNCRRCNHDLETLPHVVQHCMIHARAIQLRHNSVAKRIRVAAEGKKFNIISENQTVSNDSNLRPDLVIAKGDTAHIIDIAIPFENGEEALQAVRDEKIRKYGIIRNYLQNQYREVTIEPILVGALGAWDRKNNKFVGQLGSRRYIKTLKKLCVSDCIKWTRDIYTEHLTGQKQYT